jgi:FdhE protein
MKHRSSSISEPLRKNKNKGHLQGEAPMNSATTNRLQTVRSDHPEWNPWLTVIAQTLTEASNPRWESSVPLSRHDKNTPVLAEAAILLPFDLLSDWSRRLFRSAADGDTPAMATLRAATNLTLPAIEQLFRASLCQDRHKLEQLASASQADARAFQGVAELLPVPFLQACTRLRRRNGESWRQGYCPTCGAWPALAEVRGIERARYLRCGRCGDEWQLHWLQCPFCGINDHEQLVTLVPQESDARTIDACKRCTGYLKSFTVLQGADQFGIMVNDLASVDLDIAAVERGYRRPPDPGYFLNATVRCNHGPLRKLFSRGR